MNAWVIVESRTGVMDGKYIRKKDALKVLAFFREEYPSGAWSLHKADFIIRFWRNYDMSPLSRTGICILTKGKKPL